MTWHLLLGLYFRARHICSFLVSFSNYTEEGRALGGSISGQHAAIASALARNVSCAPEGGLGIRPGCHERRQERNASRQRTVFGLATVANRQVQAGVPRRQPIILFRTYRDPVSFLPCHLSESPAVNSDCSVRFPWRAQMAMHVDTHTVVGRSSFTMPTAAPSHRSRADMCTACPLY